MISNITKLLGAAGTLGSGTILKAIGKFVPGIGQFVSGAFTAGYAADQILDFVKDKLESPAARRNRQQLESRSEQGVARSDENAELSQMEQQRAPGNALAGLGRLGAQAAGGIVSARAGAAQQGIENQQQQQQLQLQQADQQQQQQQQAQKISQYQEQQQERSQRQARQDQNDIIRRQAADIKNKENSERQGRSEQRAIERHQMTMNKPIVKDALKKKLPADYQDALAQIDALINGMQ